MFYVKDLSEDGYIVVDTEDLSEDVVTLEELKFAKDKGIHIYGAEDCSRVVTYTSLDTFFDRYNFRRKLLGLPAYRLFAVPRHGTAYSSETKGLDILLLDGDYSGLVVADIPDFVTVISEYAFFNTSIEKVYIPSSVYFICTNAFCGCNGLTEVYILDTVRKLKEKVFSDCKNLQRVRLPKSVTEITEGMFSGCTNLKCVIAESGIHTIAEDAFKDCASLTSVSSKSMSSGSEGELVVADEVVIEDFAFGNCSSLKSVSLSRVDFMLNSATGVFVFFNCKSLESFTALNFNLQGEGLFFECRALKVFDVRDYMDESVIAKTVSDCHNLTELRLPSNLAYLNTQPLRYLPNLRKVVIPDQCVAEERYLPRYCKLERYFIIDCNGF